MRVQVYVYDLTRGMAATLSPMLLGTPIEGVWHTGVVLDGREEIFFGYGIQRTRAGTTMFGQPHHIIDVGTSEVDPAMLNELLADISPRFRPQDYSLLTHNCNHFSNELVQLLTGESVPDYIISQAQVIFNTPFGEIRNFGNSTGLIVLTSSILLGRHGAADATEGLQQ
ncbi:hypothetical protein OEZ86_001681 [Tetradesmus obliquus]|nr:hypothetical protein OEZ86_001681 [Tetradesmus obliquus]